MSPHPRRLTFGELDADRAAFDALVAQSPGADRFCSTTDWILPAQRAFAPSAEPFVVGCSDGFVAMMQVRIHEVGAAVVPLEAGWGLASPLVGPDPEPLVAALDELLHRERVRWRILLFSGLPHGGEGMEAVVGRFRRRYFLRLGARAGRCVASLDGGMDGFLRRRSAKFRATLRRARRRAAAAGMAFEYVCPTGPGAEEAAAAAFERAMAIESRSWKGRTGQGVDAGQAREFYRLMTGRLAGRGALRLLFATLDGTDVGYVLGGLRADLYRGLQVSFDQTHADLSPGNVLHAELIERLTLEGVRTYDMGQDMDYKRRWVDEVVNTEALVVERLV